MLLFLNDFKDIEVGVDSLLCLLHDLEINLVLGFLTAATDEGEHGGLSPEEHSGGKPELYLLELWVLFVLLLTF